MGKKIIAIILILAGAGAIGFGVFKYLRSQKPNAVLRVDTTPPSLVYIDNIQIGQTPIEKIFKPGEITIKLIPTSTISALTTYQTKVHLTSQTITVIRRDFGDSDITSAGEVINLEPQPGKNASLAVITSIPDSASITLDGQPQGFTPILIPQVQAGDHQIVISAPGFTPRTISAKTVAGYKLNLNAKLAGLPEPSPSPLPSATPSATLKKPYVEIKATPTGFLRVREKPDTKSQELGRVQPGDRYPLLDKTTGWYLIKVDLEATASGQPASKQGWVSAQYADKFE